MQFAVNIRSKGGANYYVITFAWILSRSSNLLQVYCDLSQIKISGTPYVKNTSSLSFLINSSLVAFLSGNARVYLVHISTTVKMYLCPSLLHGSAPIKSVQIALNEYFGSLNFPIGEVLFCVNGLIAWHVSHIRTYCCMSFGSRGQKNTCRIRLSVFQKPPCPARMLS